MNRGTMLLLITLSAPPLVLSTGCSRSSAPAPQATPAPQAAPSPTAAQTALVGSETKAPAGEAAARREIRALQARFQDAVRRKDMPGVLALLTPDFVQVSLDGSTQDRRQIEDTMRKNWPATKAYAIWTLDLTSLDMRGNVATGVVREHTKVLFQHPDGSREVIGRSRNTWVKTPSGWKYRRMATLEERTVPDDITKVEAIPIRDAARLSEKDRIAARLKARRAAAAHAGPGAEGPLTKPEARRLMERTYADYRAAVRRKDLPAVLDTITENYTIEYPDVVQTRSIIESQLKREIKAITSIPAWDMAVQDITVRDKALTVRLHEKRTNIIRDAGGRSHTVASDATLDDVWVRTRQGWKNQRTKLIHNRITVDGRLARKF